MTQRPGALPDLSARELQAVCSIAEAGSFMAAALTLGVSQPALTRMVQRVEHALGLALFRRTTRRVEVTPAGQEFVALAARILSDLRISYENMREVSDQQRGQVIVSAVMSVAHVQLPRIVARYRASRPRVEVHLREGVQGTVLDDLRSGVADIGVGYLDGVPGELEGIALAREVFHVVMPRTHPLARRRRVSLQDVAACALVSLPRESQTRRLIDGLATAAGLTLQHAVTVHQFATLMPCVQAGVGIAIVPGAAVPWAVGAGLATKPLAAPALTRTIGALLIRERGLTPSAQGFLADLRQGWAQAAATTPVH